jgi:hypothetical protein
MRFWARQNTPTLGLSGNSSSNVGWAFCARVRETFEGFDPSTVSASRLRATPTD